MPYNSSHALQLLRLGSGLNNATFRDGQEEAIRHIVEGRGRLLVVQRTGWGKSFVYFIATKLLREEGHGPALLISPLLSLMRNQLLAAQRMGVRADTINSDNPNDWDNIERAITNNEVDILLISPERLANERFRTQVLSRVAARISLLVIDEAHCISDWGHDFRPHYRLIERIVRALPPNLRLLATTATANNRVMDDLRAVLGPQLDVLRGDLNREHLAEPGRALSMWGDAGWGALVQKGKYVDKRFSDDLVKACADLVRRWNPQPAPAWVTCIPSLRHPHLVPDFARGLSLELGLPFRNALVKTQTRPEQKTMANSTQQARNVDGSLGVVDELLLAGPVLLVDDMVDSRWTLTVAAWLLRTKGSGEVWPLVLAITGNVS